MNGHGFLAIGFVVVALFACRKEPVQTATDAGAKISPVPAPNSLLAKELGADDAGRGHYSFFEEGPGCGPSRLDLDAGLGAKTGSMQFFETKGAPPKRPDEDKLSPIQLETSAPPITATSTRFHVQNTLTNRGRGPFVYQRAVDGSLIHWVSPFVDVFARAEATGQVYRWALDGTVIKDCGQLDSRQPANFITLKPGEKRENPFGDQAKENFEVEIDRPGTYTLWVVYSSCQGPEIGKREANAPIPDGMFEGNIASNGVTVRVADAPR